MKKILPISLIFAICYLLFVPQAANAICPVCTIAVGAGLEGARLLGVDDVITGIWAGALTLSLVFWTAKYLTRKGFKSVWWYIAAVALFYVFLAALYFIPCKNPCITYGTNSLWGIDKFMLGAVVGTIVLWVGEKWNAKLMKQNGGKSHFPFQKVVVPVGMLLAVTAIFAAIVYL